MCVCEREREREQARACMPASARGDMRAED